MNFNGRNLLKKSPNNVVIPGYTDYIEYMEATQYKGEDSMKIDAVDIKPGSTISWRQGPVDRFTIEVVEVEVINEKYNLGNGVYLQGKVIDQNWLATGYGKVIMDTDKAESRRTGYDHAMLSLQSIVEVR